MAAGVSEGALIINTGAGGKDFFQGARQYGKAVESLKDTVNRLGQDMAKRGGAYAGSLREAIAAARELDRAIVRADSAYRSLIRQKRALEDGGDAAGAIQLEAGLRQATERLEALKERRAALGDLGAGLHKAASGAQAAAEGVRGVGGEAQSAAARLGGPLPQSAAEAIRRLIALGDAGAGLRRAASGAQAAAEGVRSVGGEAQATAIRLRKLVSGGALGFLRKLASGAKNAAVQLAKLSARALAGGVKRLGGAVLSAGRALFAMEPALSGDGLRALARYGLGLGSLSEIMSRLRNDAAQGLEGLSEVDGRVRSATRAMSAALAQLRGSLAAAFAPIVTAAAPALTTLINLITRTVNAVGMLMAALAGQGWYMAASGAEAVGSAASGAGRGVKELKRQLAGFDQLNILGADGSGSGSGSGGSGGVRAAFSAVPIDGGIADFARRIKEMFAAGDYDGIGEALARGVNRAFEKAWAWISWDSVGATVTKYVDAFAGIFNGLAARIDWRGIGAAFAEGINTLARTLNRLFEDIDLAQLGRAVADAFNGLAEHVDFQALGQTLASLMTAKLAVVANSLAAFDWEALGPKLAAMFDALVGKLGRIAEGIDWSEMARRMAAGLSRFIAQADWRALGDFLADRVNDLFGMAASAAAGFDWVGSARRLAQALNRMIGRVDWEGVGAALNALLTGALNGAIGFFADFDTQGFAEGLGKALSRVQWREIAEKAWELLKTAFSSLGGFVAALLSGVDGDNGQVERAADGIADRLGQRIASALDGDGSLRDALGKRLSEALKGALAWLDGVVRDFDWRALGERIGKALAGIDWSGIREALSELLKDLMAGLGEAVLGIVLENAQARDFVARLLALLGPPLNLKLGAGDRSDKSTARNTQALEDNTRAVERFSLTDLASALGLTEGNSLGRAFSVDLDFKPAGSSSGAYKNGGLLDYLKSIFAPGVTTENRVRLAREGFTTVQGWISGNYLGGLVEKGVGLLRQGFDTVGGWLFKNHMGQNVDKPVGIARDRFTTVADWLGGYLGGAVTKGVGLAREKFTTVAEWIAGLMGGDVSKPVGVTQSGWGSVAAWITGNLMGGGVFKPIGVTESGWGDIGSWILGGLMGGGVFKPVGVTQSGWGDVAAWIFHNLMGGNVNKPVGLASAFGLTVAAWILANCMGGSVGQSVSLERYGWDWVDSWTKQFAQTPVGQLVNLAKNGWDWVDTWAQQFAQTPIKQEVELVKKPGNKLEYKTSTGTIAMEIAKSGGVATARGLRRFAEGGLIRGGAARWWNGIPRYAGGTSRAHGTMFLAGEAGPEIIGHVNGRTEILNKFQLAQTMYAAVSGGMLAALGRIRFREPAMATGSVMPYEVSAQLARCAADIQDTLNANNEDLIQTIISVAGQLVSAVQASGQRTPAVNGLSAQQIINEINRRTQMFAASPLKGV